MKIASCLVNPKACHESEFESGKAKNKKNIAVIGAGPAGITAALEASRRGHNTTLFEKSSSIGGQFNIAKEIPGKEEFKETIRFFEKQISLSNIDLKLNMELDKSDLESANFDEIIISTGVTPRTPNIIGINHSKVISYTDLINGVKTAGKTVAVIGSGGIGFDIAEFLVHNPQKENKDEELISFFNEWGVDMNYEARGAIKTPEIKEPARKVFLLQRKSTKHGKDLGKTTGWIHRQSLKKAKVEMIGDVQYQKIDDDGLHIKQGDTVRILDVDNIVICAGQTSNNTLFNSLGNLKAKVHIIGGALKAEEIDAKRAINDGVRLANSL